MPSTTTEPFPDVPLPAGAAAPAGWELDGFSVDATPFRMVLGGERSVTDHELRVWARAWQNGDGTLDELTVVIELAEELNSDQARELASALLETAAELDRWAGR
jgi:hypothetical protein